MSKISYKIKKSTWRRTMKTLFNNDWFFHKTRLEATEDEILHIKEWMPVDVPHDWMIYEVKHLYESSIGCYKKSFEVGDLGSNRLFLRFDGVYMDTTIYLNQEVIFEWKYGYSTFEVDLTDKVQKGTNELLVKCVYRCPNSRWYSGAGIYRNVWLIQKPSAYFVTDGSYISTKPQGENWLVDVEIEAISKGEQVEAEITHCITDGQGKEVALSAQKVSVGSKVEVYKQQLSVKAPVLWDIDQPYVYHITSKLIVKGKVLDKVTQNLGFKQFIIDPDQGAFLNGRSIKLNGVCQHHDLGALGSAFNITALRRQFQVLKEMGVNAIRTAHNMPAVELMDLADEMGLLVYTEAFDMWENTKTEFDYGLYFKDWWKKDLSSWVRRDRNHPSLILWGIGNEIYDTRFERGIEVSKMLHEAVRKLDPHKNGLTAIGSNYIEWDNAQKCGEEMDVVGYNYKEIYYDEHHKKYPNWCIFGSETSSTVQSRGIYHFPLSNRVLTHPDGQCSTLGNCTTNWGAKNVDEVIVNHRDRDFCFGQFIWSGWDYIGEPTPYFTKNSYFGQVDTAGFKKDTYYQYQAEWTDVKKVPMVHLLPYWDFNEGQLIDVCAYTNASSIELFINEKSLGRQEIDHFHGKQLKGVWQLPYTKGVLRAVAYDEQGQIVATEEKASFTDPVKIIAKPDKTEFLANGEDLVFVEISTVDENGIEVANGRSRMRVKVSGAGRLVGLDNGDSTDYDEYKGTSRRLFSGKLLAIIAAKKEAGGVEVTITSPGLEKAKLKLQALPAKCREGISCFMENMPSPVCEEVPVRKIELTCEGSRHLNPDETENIVTAQIFPKNATYQEIDFKAMTLEGIESNSVKVEVEGNTAIIIAKGDGDFRLCASINNGRDLPEVISELEFEVTGMGKANLDPYGFVSGCQCTKASHLATVSFQGGAFIDTEDCGWLMFEDVDFGEFGSDEITVPIFSFKDEIPIEIWQGEIGEKGTCLVKAMYKAKSWYNHYQSNTYQLPKRLKGLQTITIKLSPHECFSMQGFSFKKLDKAYSTIYATENTRVTGDSFRVEEEAITHIGNNVTLEYHHIDFGEKGCSSIKLCGHSYIPMNTINLQFIDPDGKTKVQSIEVPYSEDYTEVTFPLENVKGACQVNLMFLPGSQFDLKWFKFE